MELRKRDKESIPTFGEETTRNTVKEMKGQLKWVLHGHILRKDGDFIVCNAGPGFSGNDEMLCSANNVACLVGVNRLQF
jgi:hypothetical protein